MFSSAGVEGKEGNNLPSTFRCEDSGAEDRIAHILSGMATVGFSVTKARYDKFAVQFSIMLYLFFRSKPSSSS